MSRADLLGAIDDAWGAFMLLGPEEQVRYKTDMDALLKARGFLAPRSLTDGTLVRVRIQHLAQIIALWPDRLDVTCPPELLATWNDILSRVRK